MFVYLTAIQHDSVTTYTITIFLTPNYQDFDTETINFKLIMDFDNFKTFTLTHEEFLQLRKVEKVIQMGITLDGFDTNEITPEQREVARIRDIHPALFGMYFRGGSNAYLAYMTGNEKLVMTKEYVNYQLILKILKQNRFHYISDSEPKIQSIYQTLESEFEPNV